MNSQLMNTLIVLSLAALAGLFAWWFLRERKRQDEFEELPFLEDGYYDSIMEVEDRPSHPAPSEDHAVSAPTPPPAFSPTREWITVLYLIAPPATPFLGNDVLSVLTRLGFQHGAMNIFHHYGLEPLPVGASATPVFSVANLVEPGALDPRELPRSTTPGLAIFLRLPGPLSGRVAFELMLNHAQRLAELLHGKLQDEQRQALTQAGVMQTRARIDAFEAGH